MYFGTYQYNNDYQPLTCMICLVEQIKYTNNDIVNVIHKNKVKGYHKSCNCKLVIHLTCLNKWLHVGNNKCPICKQVILHGEKYEPYYQTKMWIKFFITKNAALIFLLFILFCKYIIFNRLFFISKDVYGGLHDYGNYRNLL